MAGFEPTRMDAAALFDTFAEDVYKYVRRRTDANDAEDLVSEVFVVACRRLSEIPDGAELPWLYRTGWNLVANHWRKHQAVAVEQVPETADEFDDFANLVTESAALREAWAGLGARDREVLRLVVWEGVDGAGLAAALGISVSGAGAALWRARHKLQQGYAAATEGGEPIPRPGGADPREIARKKLPTPDIGEQR